jgi:hypothetical protein
VRSTVAVTSLAIMINSCLVPPPMQSGCRTIMLCLTRQIALSQ